jgi:phospholipid/cholesterol/gamma-HCH transport system substrate-binding protein
MKQRLQGHTLKLGIFVTVGTLLFIIAIYMLGKQKNIFGTTFTLSCGVSDVSGLMIGNNVRFSGINVGTVDDIVIMNDTLVRIDMVIQNDVRKFIKKDSKAVIGSEGLMGNKLVNILPGSPGSEIVENGDVIVSARPIDINQILTSLQRTGENITTDLAEVMHKVSHGQGTVGKILTDSMFAETIHKSLLNIERGTAGFSENMEALKHNFLLRRYFKKKEEKEQEAKKNKNKKDDDDDD